MPENILYNTKRPIYVCDLASCWILIRSHITSIYTVADPGISKPGGRGHGAVEFLGS